MERLDYEKMLIEIELKLEAGIVDLLTLPHAMKNPRLEEYIRTYALAREYLKDKVKCRKFEELHLVNSEIIQEEVKNEG